MYVNFETHLQLQVWLCFVESVLDVDWLLGLA